MSNENNYWDNPEEAYAFISWNLLQLNSCDKLRQLYVGYDHLISINKFEKF